MRYLLHEQVLFLHSRLIEETGGIHGVRDLGMLLSAPGRPKATFEHAELYSDIYSKCAALPDSLIRNHPISMETSLLPSRLRVSFCRLMVSR